MANRQWALTLKGRILKGGVRDSKIECWAIAYQREWPKSTIGYIGPADFVALQERGYGVVRVALKVVAHGGNDE